MWTVDIYSAGQRMISGLNRICLQLRLHCCFSNRIISTICRQTMYFVMWLPCVLLLLVNYQIFRYKDRQGVFRKTRVSVISNWSRGVLVFPKFLTFFMWTQRNWEFRRHRNCSLNRQFQCLKHKKLPNTNSTKSGGHWNFAQIQEKEHIPGKGNCKHVNVNE